MNPSVEDRLAITELLSEYGLLLDQHQLADWLDLFVEDAVMEVPGLPPLRGRAERRALVETAPTGLHLCAPPILRAGEADGTASARQSFMFRNSKTGQVLAGWYADELVKRGDRWHIARRVIRYLKAPVTSERPPSQRAGRQ
jgi:3-phenylpropionate/cinnamic acid dioxygenase small subunit